MSQNLVVPIPIAPAIDAFQIASVLLQLNFAEKCTKLFKLIWRDYIGWLQLPI